MDVALADAHTARQNLPGSLLSRTVLQVLLVDDRIDARQRMTDAIEDAADLAVVGQASTSSEARGLIASAQPNVVVVGHSRDDTDLTWCRDLTDVSPGTNYLVLSESDDGDAVLSAIYAGAAGYILEGTSTSEILTAIRVVGRGDSTLDPAVTETVLARVRRMVQSREPAPEPDRLAALSEDERALLWLITDGLSNRQIGERLTCTEQAVKHYVSRLLSKLHMQRRSQVAAFGATLRATSWK